MRVFVCEYITGGGLHSEPLPLSLLREGTMMVGALLRDLAGLDNLRIVASRDSRIQASDLAPSDLPVRWSVPQGADDVWPSWERAIADADAVWPIAPETGGCLGRLSEMVLAHRRILLGSSVEAIHITSSKRATARILARRGVPVVPTHPARGPLPHARRGWVAKPDDGAGAEDTRLFHDAEKLRRWLNEDGRAETHVIQPFAEGRAASLSVLVKDGEARLLSCNSQHIATDGGRFRYVGGVVGGREENRRAFAPIAAAIAAAIPGLWGYIGVDLVETGQGPVVLEVNPRLTTSYVGLAAATGCNPARLVLDLLDGGGAPFAPPAGPLAVTPVEVNVDAERAAPHA